MNLTVVGSGKVGKTALLTSYKFKKFPDDPIPKLFNNSENKHSVDIRTELDEVVNVQLNETLFTDFSDRLRPLYYVTADVFVLCFAIDFKNSFTDVTERWAWELRHWTPKVPLLLVGTKSDLREKKNENQKDVKLISVEEGQKLAKKIKAVKYLECSALTRGGVDQLFKEAFDAGMVYLGKKEGIREKKTCNLL